jgi:2'-5' RNA ligase
MSKIAIDVVLLPDNSMTNQAVGISRRQFKKFSGKIILNKENCLPHISLAMGGIKESDLQKVTKTLQDIASKFHTFELIADTYHDNTIPSKEIVSEFIIKKAPELQSLHEIVMTKLKPFLLYDISINTVFSPPAVEEITLCWIKNYAKKSSFNNFNPHITIGFRKLDDINAPINFTASTLALCHLGNYCTCRKILFSKNLNRI